VHDISDHLALYLEVNCRGIHPRCSCSDDCESLLKWSGWKKGFLSKYARGHNARVDSVYKNPDRQAEMAEKRKSGFSEGRYSVWNKGLTKESSTKVKESSEKISAALQQGYLTGLIQDWRVNDPKKAKEAALKISKSQIERFTIHGSAVWNKGLTKETSEKIASIAEKISLRYEGPEAGRRLKQEELLARIQKYSDKFTLISSSEDYRARRVARMTFMCVSCGHAQEKSLAMLEESPVCFSCSPKESKGQLEVYEFVRSLAPDAVLSDRSVISPRELDVWIPSCSLALEYNGLYWHSSSNISDERYHVKKLEECRKKGVSLLSVYEDEWRDKRIIVEGMIRHRLRKPIGVKDARKLVISRLESHSAQKFFDENHLEGHVPGSAYIGLVDGVTSEIFAGISLRKPFHKKYENYLELGRCCTKVGYSVRGWLGRLTSAAVNHAVDLGVKNMITYVDSRVGSGSGYSAAGWRLVEEGRDPRFWWTDYHKRYNRFKFRADKESGLTQEQVAKQAGVVQIYGMPNSVYQISCNGE